MNAFNSDMCGSARIFNGSSRARAACQRRRFDKVRETGFLDKKATGPLPVNIQESNLPDADDNDHAASPAGPPRLDAEIENAALVALVEVERRLFRNEKPSVARLAFDPPLEFARAYWRDGWFRRGAQGLIDSRMEQLHAFLAEALHFQMSRPRRARAEADPAMIPAYQRGDGALDLSATIICKDEGAYIAKCLASLNGFSEIVVVDSGSTDATLPLVKGFIARGWPIRLFQRGWPGYAKQKQFAWEQARCDWVLSIDSDEWLDEDLRRDIPNLLRAPMDVAGWSLRRPLAIYGQEDVPPKATRPERIPRLARRGQVHFDESALVHEGLVANGKMLVAKKGLLRHDRALRIDRQIVKEMTYARLKAEQRILRGKKPSLLKMVFNPSLYFLRVFFSNRAFLYGLDGLILARTRAAYSFIGEGLHWQLWRER